VSSKQKHEWLLLLGCRTCGGQSDRRPIDTEPHAYSIENNRGRGASSKPLPSLEFELDELRSLRFDVCPKMDVTVTTSECACLDRGGFGRSIGEREVQGLFGEED